MKISNPRTNISKQQFISAYDQSRIDAAKEKSDARAILRANADKASAEHSKSLLDNEKTRMDLEKLQIEHNQTKALVELTRFNNEQTWLKNKTLEITREKDLLDKERLILNKEVEKAKLEVENNNLRKETLKAEAIKAQADADKARADADKARADADKVLAMTNAAENNAIIISSQLELKRIALEKTNINNAPAYAAKAQADALMQVQRSKIMKTLQFLSINSCKRVDELYFKKSVTSITNIYQKKYNNNKYATGFGDFIRGCYFMLDFCELFHFHPNIVINHPLIEFLENLNTSHNYQVEDNSVSMFGDNNWNKHILNRDNIIINTIREKDSMKKFVHYLCSSPIDNNHNINIYNILFPYFDVSTEHQQIMRDILKPSQEMKDYVFSTLKQFELTENNYISIHIRSGDNYLTCVDHKFNTTYLTRIKNNIIMLLKKHPDSYFLLIADNNLIKRYLSSQQIDRLYIIFNEIGHLGENSQLDRNKVRNTMLDFYLFSYSSNIYAFSSYDHGSGFSFWCAKTYSIPYACKIIKH